MRHDDRFEAFASQLTDRSFGLGDVGDVNFEIAEDPAQYAKDLLIRGKNE